MKNNQLLPGGISHSGGPLSGAQPSWPRTSAPTPWARLPSTAPGITSPCCPCWWFWLFQAASRKDRPQVSPGEKKAQRRQLWLGGFCCGTVLAIASNFQQAGLVAGTDGGKAGFITALYVVLVPVFGLFFRRRVSLPVWIAVAPVRGRSVPAVSRAASPWPPGDLLVLVCAICFSVHILVIDHFTATCDGGSPAACNSCLPAPGPPFWPCFFRHHQLQVLLDCIWPLPYVGVFSCGGGLHPANPGSEGLQSHGGHHSAEPGERVVSAVIAGAVSCTSR